MSTKVPSVAEWFRGRSVFVTGGTGFMGKVLVYKLLASCRDLDNVFLLVREKKGADPRTRFQLLMQEEPFKVLKESHPETLKKIILVSGDTVKEDLGLSASDKERILSKVSVVFHMAANVKFDLTIKEAVSINTVGTRNVLNFAKQMSHLTSFVHVSTSYCHCSVDILEERAYPVPMDPEEVIKTVNELSDEELAAMTPKLLGTQPNSYAFSKALSEDLVERSGLPIAVARPSIVTASWKEPVPGWVDNMNGPTGLMIGAGKGVIRTLYCESSNILDTMPCDMAINATISLAWKVGVEKPSRPIFVNVTVDRKNAITWDKAIEAGRKHAIANPFTGILWYPGGQVTSSKISYYTRLILFQILPAYILDFFIGLTGNKPFLVRVQNKICNAFDLFQYYVTKEWYFRHENLEKLEQQLSPADREIFFMDTKQFCWDDYILTYLMGIRKYFLRDDPSTLPRARNVISVLYYADWFLKIVFGIFLAWLVYYWIFSTKELTTTIIEPNNI